MECLTPEELVREFQKRLIEWGREHYEQWPWRVDRTPYRALIAELLLKRTTRQAAGREYPKFIKRFPDIESVYRASLEELREAFRPLGLYNQRAKQLKELARVVFEKYGGQIPDTLEGLKSLPGVNDYIAGAVLSFGFGVPAPTPDSNALRVLSRATGIGQGSAADRRKLYKVLERLVPKEGHEAFNYALLDLGGSVCHYQYPKCERCPLRGLCVYATKHPQTKECLKQSYQELAT